MLYILFQLLILLVVSVLIAALFRSRWMAWPMSVLLAGFICLQVSSVYMGGSLIDYKYYMHTGTLDWALVREFFLWQAIVLVCVFVLLLAGIYFGSRRLRKWDLPLGRLLGALLLGGLLLSIPEGVLYNLFEVGRVTTVSQKSFDEALKALNIPPDQYVTPEDVKATKGKNIIVISMESFEHGFLRKPLDHLTPNLRAMADSLTLFNMSQSPGSDWTAASIYTSITGFPAYFRSKPNEVFQRANQLNLTGVGHILKKAGYDLTYLMGNKEFGGVDKMLEACLFEVVSEKDLMRKHPKSGWGLHDKDLLDEARELVLKKEITGQPFALFMSTISTHLPDGVYDSRLESLVPPQRSQLEFMVAGVDYLIGSFIQFLEDKGFLENTCFLIYPDHLIMGTIPVILNDIKDFRQLFLLTNADTSDLSFNPDETISQLDIPKLILEAAQVQHNVQFFSEFIPKDVAIPSYIQKHKKEVVALNEAALVTDDFSDGFRLEYVPPSNLKLSSASANLKVNNLNTNPGKVHVFTFDRRMRVVKHESASHFEAFETSKYKSYHPHLIVRIKNGRLMAYLRRENKVGILRSGDRAIEFSESDIATLKDWDFTDKEFRLPRRPHYETPYDLLFLTSGTGGTGELLTPGQIKLGKLKLPIEKGINLLTKNGEQYLVTHFDIAANPKKADTLRQTIQTLNQEKRFFALVAQQWQADIQQYASEFEKIGCEQLATLQPGETYIGYAYHGFISEWKASRPISISLPDVVRSPLRSQQQIETDGADVSKFIAHAGGAIGGNRYTNSLEAMNLSYKKGFRYFELDIRQTSDDNYVALHDWGTWRRHTGYKGVMPVTTEEFLKHKILQKYTPLAMDQINDWFASHPDAILITDKVDEPQQFASAFVDKSRLVMELFSIGAAEEAIREGIKLIPSEKLLGELSGDKVAWLLEKKIGQVALSRNALRTDLAFLRKLKEGGIRVFVYHVNSEKGKNEAYVLCNDFDYVYGMYADDWTFVK